MRRDLKFYEKFPRLRELIVSLPFEEDVSIEQKQKAFRSLVDLLIKQGVYKNDGSVTRCRESCLQYLEEIVDLLDEPDLQQLLSEQKVFFDRFIFSPCRSITSLYATLKNRRVSLDPLWDVPVSILFSYFKDKTGKSPYEKSPRTMVNVFINEVEGFR